MAELADRLSELVEAGQPVSFTAIAMSVADVLDGARELAAGPMAPLLAEAITADDADGRWTEVTPLFIGGLAQQRSVLALSSALEVLLGRPAALGSHGTALLGALLDQLPQAVHEAPILAGTRLDAAVRLAVGKAVSPFRVWDFLDQLSVRDAPEEFIELLPRTLGAALDSWADEAAAATILRRLLSELAQLDASDSDAVYELGCDRLRIALSSTDLTQVTQHLIDARRELAASTADEARRDADCLVAACDAVLAFSRHDTAAVADAATRLTQALEQLTAWQLRTHQPAWTHPRRSALLGWHQLLLLLDTTSGTLADPVWMAPWNALDAVLSAYSFIRTVQPLGSDANTGVALLVKPAIEDVFLREQNFLQILERAVAQPEQHIGHTKFDHPSGEILLAKIRSRQARTPSAAESNAITGPDNTEDEDPRATQRLYRMAPLLVRTMGEEAALDLIAGLTDDKVAFLGGLAEQADQSRFDANDPVVLPILNNILGQLAGHPYYTGRVPVTFSALVYQTVLFLKSRLDLNKTSLLGKRRRNGEPVYDYRQRPEKDQPQPLEEDLQLDFRGWLDSGPLHHAVSAEPVDLAMGRGDIIVRFDALHYLAEIKKDDVDNSRKHIEAAYLTQTAEYSNTNVPFGLLLVLDLTPKTSSGGTLRLDELIWVASHRPAGATVDRRVVVGILPGNRLAPSDYSK
ncbi:hypothetical protein [Nocardia salmonicida]|uniref:hypothetical protein n=1 Tax=Nocardia salmonicida TaxID=53431 RepID=UPI0007A46DCC|nr:hypothetical protein [Nocardia salmonicida]